MFVELMTFSLVCLKLYDLPVNYEPAFMAELLKHFVACMDPFHSPNLIPSMKNQTEEGVQPAHLFPGLIMSSITAPLLVAVFLTLGISLCSFMLSPPKTQTVGLNVIVISYHKGTAAKAEADTHTENCALLSLLQLIFFLTEGMYS